MKLFLFYFLFAACSHPIALPRKLPRDSTTLCKPYFAKLVPASVPGTEDTIKQMDAYMGSGVTQELHNVAHRCWGDYLDKESIDSEGVACLFGTLGGKRKLEIQVGTHEEFSAPQDVLDCIQKKATQVLSAKPFKGPEVDLFQPLNLAVVP